MDKEFRKKMDKIKENEKEGKGEDKTTTLSKRKMTKKIGRRRSNSNNSWPKTTFELDSSLI